MSDYNIIIPIKEYEMLKKVYEERNKPLEYPYGKAVALPVFNNITGYYYDTVTKYYHCKEDLFKDFERDNSKLRETIKKQSEQISELQELKEKIANAPTFLGYKYFKP